MRVLRGQDLLQGSDHEFITNLYRRILLRGPDDGELPAAPAPVAATPAAPPSKAAAKSPEDLLAELRQSVVGLDATRLVAVEANLLACLGDVRTARLAALAKGRA